jgi:hypothetical protein
LVPDRIVKKILGLIIIMICIGHRSVSAYDLEYRPSLSVDITWDDNIEDEPADTKEDYYFGATPRIVINGKGERSTIRLDGRVSGRVYSKFEEFNEISSYRLNGNLNYDPSKSFQFILPVAFLFSPTAETAREDIIVGDEEAGVPATVEIVRRADRYHFFAGPSFRYKFTERVSSTLGGTYRTTQYSEDIAGVTDSVAYSARGGLNYALTRKTTGGINVSYTENDFEKENDSRVYTSTLSITHLYSRAFTLRASGGVSYISVETEDNTLDFVGSVEGRLRLKRANYIVNLRRAVEDSTFGNTITRDSARGTFSIPLSRRTDFFLDGNVSRNVSSNGNEDLLVKRVAMRFEYLPLKHLSLFIRGSYEDQDERAFAGQDVRINRVSAGFTLWADIQPGSINE